MPIMEHLSSETNVVQTVRYWDKAGTQDAGAYTAGVKMSILKNGKLVIQDVVRGQWSTDNREAVIKANADSDGYRVRIGIEQEPGSGGKESAENTTRNLMGFMVETVRPTGDKVTRALPFSAQVNIGNVSMVKGEWNRAYINELTLFPNSKYKDQVDASSVAFSILAFTGRIGVIK